MPPTEERKRKKEGGLWLVRFSLLRHQSIVRIINGMLRTGPRLFLRKRPMIHTSTCARMCTAPARASAGGSSRLWKSGVDNGDYIPRYVQTSQLSFIFSKKNICQTILMISAPLHSIIPSYPRVTGRIFSCVAIVIDHNRLASYLSRLSKVLNYIFAATSRLES